MRWKKLGRSKNIEHRRGRSGDGGDFSYAYDIAHEVGHHAQKLLRQTDKVHRQKGRVSEVAYNRLSVRLELQADFLESELTTLTIGC